MTLLVGTDFSASSFLVADAAAAVARARNELLVLVHITDRVTAGDEARMLSEVTRLEGVCRVMPLMEAGRPTGERFAAIARETGADLVVIGAQGSTRRIPLGTVATSTIEHVRDLPVLVVRAPERLLRTPAKALATVALDETDDGVFRALELLLAAGIKDVDAIHYRALPTEAADRHQASLLIERDVLERFRALPQGMRLHTVLARDGSRPIEDDIGNLARLRDADVIVCGSHHRRGLDRFVHGSVSERIVQHAPVSVLVSPAPAHEQRAEAF